MGDFSESKASREEAELRAPFVRNDRFGEFGMGNLPTCLKAVLALESIFILPFRAVGSFLCLFLYWLVCRLSSPLPPQHRAAIVVPMGKLACRSCLFCIGFFKVEWVLDPAAGQGPRAGGIVSNHCSWADILLHMSHSFPAFVARDSTANLPFIGIISQMMSCLYVNRNRTGRNQAGVADLVKQRMEDEAAGRTGVEKRPLLLFPEGTTSNGEYMLPFKTGAFLAGEPVLPVVIKYHRLPVYVPNEAEKADPKLYADNVRKMMMEHSGTKDTRATFEDKMRYLTMLKKHKRWTELFFLAYSPVWITWVLFILVPFKLYEGLGEWGYMAIGLAAALPVFLLPPLLQPKHEAGKPWVQRYWVKANIWIAIFSFVGNYVWTHYFYQVLGAAYTFKAHELNGVPITLYFMTHAYFALYHALANVLIRKARSMVGPRSPNLRILAEAVVVFVLAYSTAYAETLTISHFPYYTHKAGDKERMYTVGSLFYAIYFFVSFPMFFRMDEDPKARHMGAKPYTLWKVVVDSLAACMLVTLLLDFWRLAVTAQPGLPWLA